ncbi:MAG TPA: hypothetical protein VJ304_06625, partial [Flavobacterium sp.]|nr:hypothetical protein [Flavobacterium sp.]
MRLIISFLIFFVLNIGFAQKKQITEQEYLALQDKIRLHFNANVDSALVYAYQLEKSNDNKHLAFANGTMTVFFQRKGNIKESRKRYQAAFYYLEKMPESDDKTQMRAYIYNYGGLAEWTRGNFSKALEDYKTGLKFSTQIGDVKQIIKIKGNIALVNEAVGNYQISIKNLKSLIEFVDENEGVFTKLELLNYKSNYNLGLGTAYESYFMKNLTKRYLLDSSEYYYKKTINYSQNSVDNKISAQLSLGNLYNWKHDFKSAEKTYYDVIFLAQQNNITDVVCIANYNLGDIYYTTKKYDKALVFFKRCDSVAAISNTNTIAYLKSNFYQAKIYNILKQPDLAYKHSKIYLDNYEKYEAKLSKEALEVNYKQGVDELATEMVSIEKKYKNDVFLGRGLKVFYVLLFIGIVFLLIKNIRDKNKANKKMNALIEEFKANIEKKNNPEFEIAEKEELVLEHEEIQLKKE